MNCAEVKDDLVIEDMIAHLFRTPDDYKGMLLDKEKEEIINIVNEARTISSRDKGLIINSLGN